MATTKENVLVDIEAKGLNTLEQIDKQFKEILKSVQELKKQNPINFADSADFQKLKKEADGMANHVEKKMKQASDSMTIAVKDSVKGTSSSMKQGTEAAEQLAQALKNASKAGNIHIKVSRGNMDSELKAIKGALSDLSSHSNRIFGSILTGITTGITSRLPSITEIAKGAIKDIGDLQYSMMGIGGQIAPKEGVDKAVQIQNQMLAYQRKSVQSNVALSEGMAYLLESNNADDSLKQLQQIDNVVSMTGGDIKNTAKAISQAQGMHALRGQEINQLVNSQASVIVNQTRKNVEDAARAGKLGTSDDERASNKSIQEAADRGEGASIFDLKRQDPKKFGVIEIKYLNEALEQLGGSTGKFAKGVDIASQTLKGSIQNTKESIQQAGAQALGYYIDPKTGIGKFTEGSVLYVATQNITKIQGKITDMLFDKDGNIKQSVVQFSKDLGTQLQKAIDYLSSLDWQSIWVKAKDTFSTFFNEGKQLAKDFDVNGTLGVLTEFAKVAHPIIFTFLDMLAKNAGSVTTLFMLNKAFTTIAGPMSTFIDVAKGFKGLMGIGKGGKGGVEEMVLGETSEEAGGAFGKLSGAFGKIGGAIMGAEVAIAGAAGDIFLMGRALNDMHKNMKGISWDSLSNDLLKMGGATLAIETFVATTGMIGASNPFILLGEVVGTIMTGLADLNISMMDDTFKKLKRIQKNLTSMAGFQITGDISTGIANTKKGISQLHAAVVGTSGGDSLSKLATEVYNDFVTGPTPLSKAVDGVNEGIKQLKDFGTAVSNLVSTAGSIKVDAIKGAMDTIRDSMKQLASAMGADETDIFNASQNVNTNLNSTKNVGATTEGLYNFKPQPQGPQNGSKTGSKQFAGTLLTSLKAAADNAKKLYDDGIKPYSDALLNLANAKEGIDKNTAGAAAVFSSLSKSLTDLNNAIMNADSVQQFDTNSAANMLAANLDALGTSMSDIVKQTYNLGKALLDVQETFNQSGKDLSHALIRGMLSALKTGRINARITEMMQAVKTDDVTSTGARIGKALSDGIISSLAIGSIQAQLNTLTAPNLAAKVTYSNEFIGPLPTGAKRATKALGGSVGTDTIPALLSAGEYVMRKSASEFWGKSLLSKINNFDVNGVYNSLATKIGGNFGGGVNNSSYDNSRRTTNVNVINRNHGRMGRSEMNRIIGGF